MFLSKGEGESLQLWEVGTNMRSKKRDSNNVKKNQIKKFKKFGKKLNEKLQNAYFFLRIGK